MSTPAKDVQDALAALERLALRHKVISVEDARAAARLLANDPHLEFPPPRPPPAATPSPSPPTAPPAEPPADAGNGTDEAPPS